MGYRPDSKFVTLAPNVDQVVTLDGTYSTIEVMNLDGGGAIYWLPSPSDAEVAAGLDPDDDDSWALPSTPSAARCEAGPSSPTEVLIVSDGTTKICILAR